MTNRNGKVSLKPGTSRAALTITHAVVNVDPGRLPAKDLEPRGWQWAQGWSIKLLKGAAPTTRQLLESALVQIDQQKGNRPVELDQAEELAVAQPGQCADGSAGEHRRAACGQHKAVRNKAI